MKKIGAVILVLSLFGLLLMTQAFRGQRATLVEAIMLLGSPVRDTEGTDVGKIEQLLINPEKRPLGPRKLATSTSRVGGRSLR